MKSYRASSPSVDTVKGLLFAATLLVKARQHGQQQKKLKSVLRSGTGAKYSGT